ncbi:MAG: Unknown protein [uncultured Sulfurovum sp.]|uniref:Porin n=1 Tax=uncultured Sulfurovum sp. TaxID=269237 RepID=A0A6S6SV08_9BACT|nr:MAG: Unknown protein [uncultured Sulfurovum sp.]
MNNITKITLSMVAVSSLVLGATSEELEAQLKALQTEFSNFKKEQTATNEALVEEVAGVDNEESETSSTSMIGSKYESVSDLGLAASKVYHSNSTVSIGGYGEYTFRKYSDYKNNANTATNATLNKATTNVARFVPYFGFKFNDWIVMNTEIEFEDGGARSDDTKNYKYAIVEFSYLDFLFDEKYNLRVGHVLVPFGNINLNHEPTSFLTAQRPLVESYIIPSTWHTNGALVYGKKDKWNYYAGVVTSPDASNFTEGRYMQQGRLGAKQYTDDLTYVARVGYNVMPGLDVGGSFSYGESSNVGDVTMTMGEVHATYKNNGFDIQALAVAGQLGGDYQNVNTETLSKEVDGQYLTVGYDVLNTVKTSQKLFAVAEIERLNMDASDETAIMDNNKFFEYTAGIAYYPDPKVVVKAEYNLKDYNKLSSLADEEAIQATLGFIF